MTTEKQVVKVSVPELVEVLKQVEKSTFINVTMVTVPTMNKGGNPFFGIVKKVTNCNYLIGNGYEDRVNSNEKKEGLDGDFQSMKPSGKTHVSKCVLVDDKTGLTYYLMVERFDEVKPKVEYLKNDEPMTEPERELLSGWLKKPSETTRQDQERVVSVITPKIENIKTLSLNGVVYEVE
jgi:hypothetical protein